MNKVFSISEVIEASKILQEDWGISSDIWSVTSYSELRRDGEDIYRYNRLNPDKKDKQPYINKVLSNHDGPVIAVSDYVKLVAEQVSPYIRKRYFTALGTDGFGRSDTRQNLRSHFEINKEYIVISALDALKREKKINASLVVDALKKYNINTKKENPIKK